jgi:hypothetical protein
MLKLLNKQVFDECSRGKRETMVRKRQCDVSGEMTHTCVMCVPIDSIDMGYQSPPGAAETNRQNRRKNGQTFGKQLKSGHISPWPI